MKFFFVAFQIVAQILFITALHASDIVFEKVTRDIKVEKDGTFVQRNSMLVQMKTEAGAKGMGQVPIPFSESLQELEIIEAYTLKPDGTRLDVKKEAIFTQAAPVAVSAPMFNDIKYRIIVFPEPTAGGKLFFAVQVKQKVPFFPGHISFVESMPTRFEQENTEIFLSAPANYKLKTDVRGYEGGLVETNDGRKHWKWTLKNLNARKPEPYELVETDFGPYVAISSFVDWADLGKAYTARADAKLIATDILKAQAADIVKGAKDKREEVRRIHEWVARNVRYVGVFLGLGGYVPRDITQIIETKYGDCKDHTALMIALLRARGIDATTALIQTQAAFQLPKVPVVGAFNHAITYVPQFDLYLDATSEFTAWDVLPTADAGKTVLLTGQGKLGNTPQAIAANEVSKSVAKIKISEDGAFTGTTTVTSTGNNEGSLRATLANIAAGEIDKFASAWIKRAGPQSTANLKKSDPRDFSKPLTFEMIYEVKDALSLDSPGAFRIPRGIMQNPVSAVIGGDTQLGKRITPFGCTTETRIEDYEIVLPEKVEVAALPKEITFEGKTIKFESKYRQENNKIIAKRTLVRARLAAWCEPEMWAERELLDAAIARDGRGQVLLK